MSPRASSTSSFLMTGIELAIAIAIALFLIASLTGDLTTLPAITSGMILCGLCLSLSAMLYRAADDRLLRVAFLGLIAMFAIQVVSGLVWYILPLLTGNAFFVKPGMLLMLVSYLPLIVALSLVISAQRIRLHVQVRNLIILLNILFAFATLYLILTRVAGGEGIEDESLIFWGSLVLDVAVITLCAVLGHFNRLNVRQYIFWILSVVFFLSLIGDALSLIDALGLMDAINYAQFAYSLMLMFETVTLLLYSITSVNRVLVNRVNRELHDTRRMIDDLLAHTPDAMCIADPEGDIFKANEFFLQVLGLSPDMREKINIFKDSIALGAEVQRQIQQVRVGRTVVLNGLKITGIRDGAPDRYFDVKMFPTFALSGDVSSYVVIAVDVTDREHASEALRKSEARYRGVVEDQTELICRFAADGVHTFVNDAYCHFFHRPREELLGQAFPCISSISDTRTVAETIRSLSRDHPVRTQETRLELPGGEPRWVQWTFRAIYDIDGGFIEYQTVGRDVTGLKLAQEALKRANDELESRVLARTAELAATNEALQLEIGERRSAEAKIRSSLREKEVLLKEIHHRVKNNLQIISSLFGLQASRTGDEKSLQILKESQNRIRSIAMIHERLYQSKDLAAIDFPQYVQGLTSNLNRSYSLDSPRISIVTDVADITFGIDTAIPCGLIINELVSNSFKYAFPGDMGGEIYVGLRRDTEACLLEVRDNGVGLPAAVDVHNTTSLGLQLVTILVEQLDGRLEVSRQNGTSYRIWFNAPLVPAAG